MNEIDTAAMQAMIEGQLAVLVDKILEEVDKAFQTIADELMTQAQVSGDSERQRGMRAGVAACRLIVAKSRYDIGGQE